MNTLIAEAVAATEAAAAAYDKAFFAYCRAAKGTMTMPVATGTVVEVEVSGCKIEAKSVYGGNSMARHVRTTFKLNGKRASRAAIEAI